MRENVENAVMNPVGLKGSESESESELESEDEGRVGRSEVERRRGESVARRWKRWW